MAKRDYYDVLGVNKSSTADQIKSAYRKLAIKHHPDKNKGDKAAEEKFKEASEAYHVLSNAERKQSYDNFGHAAFENGGGGRGGFGNFDFSSHFSDIFEDFLSVGFGGGRRSRRSNNRGSDLRYDYITSNN
jgi:molecular chaperone DnaJ